jgi:DHA1 family tetracycline resistance protein-like MFS transporter
MASAPAHPRKTLWIAFAIVLADMLGVGILIPIIPLLFTDPSYTYHLGISAHTGYLLLGALTALYPFSMFLAMPVLGQLSDTFGRRRVLMFSLFGTGLSYVLFALGIMGRSIPLLFGARLLDGITGGNVAVVQASVADISTEEERVRKFSVISAANGIGFILGPLVGGLLSDPLLSHAFGAPTPFWFAAGLSFVNMLAVLFFFPETIQTRTKKRIRLGQAFANIKDAATGIERRHLYITSFFFPSGFAFIVTFFGVYLVSRFGFGQRRIGYLFALVGLVLALTQIFITRPLSRRVAPQTIIPLALAVMSASLVGVYFANDLLLLCVFTVPAAMSAALVLTNLTAFISTTSKDRQQGSVLGVNSSVQALAQSIPPIFAGAIAAIFSPTTPILFAAFTIGVAALFYYVYCRSIGRTPNQ